MKDFFISISNYYKALIAIIVGICTDMYIQKLVFIEAFTANIPLSIGAAYPFIFLFVLFVITCFRSKSE